MEEAPTPNETISFENFSIESDKHKEFKFTILNKGNKSINISAIYEDKDFLLQKYEKTFILDNLKNIAYFSLFNSIKEIYEEIIYLIKQKQKDLKIMENSNGIVLTIPLEGLKFKEITLFLDSNIKDEKENIKNLYSIIKNLIDKNKILENNQGKLEERVKNLENEIKTLKNIIESKKEDKIINLNSLIIGNNDEYNIYIKKWIDSNSKIKAELLYRLSTNGNEYTKFHELCDNKCNTLLLVKLADGNILGGFTTQNWDNSYKWKKDPRAFVFSLTKRLKANSNNSSKEQIYCDHYRRGPCFGFFLYFYDRKMDELRINKISKHFSGSDILFDGEDKYYKAIEVEVFKIIIE